MARSKLQPKTHGTFEVIDTSTETVTIKQDGIDVKVSIDRCTLHPILDVEAQRLRNETPQNQAAGTIPSDETDIFHSGEPLVPQPLPPSSPPALTRLVMHSHNGDKEKYTGLYTDGTTKSDLSILNVPAELVSQYWRTILSNQQSRQKFRRRGRPRQGRGEHNGVKRHSLSQHSPRRMPASNSADP